MKTYETGMTISVDKRPAVSKSGKIKCDRCTDNVSRTQEPWVVIDGGIVHWSCIAEAVLTADWREPTGDAT